MEEKERNCCGCCKECSQSVSVLYESDKVAKVEDTLTLTVRLECCVEMLCQIEDYIQHIDNRLTGSNAELDHYSEKPQGINNLVSDIESSLERVVKKLEDIGYNKL